MALNIKDITYTAKAILKDGSTVDLTPAIIKRSRQEPTEEIAQRVNLTLAQVKTQKGYLHEILPLCTIIVLYANNTEVFRGIVWEWEFTSSKQKEVDLMCYDHFIYSQRSKNNAYYSAGKSTKDIISDICSKNSIKLSYSYDSISHAKVLYKAQAISEQILRTLEDAKSKLKSNPVARYDKGTLTIGFQGQNKEVYVFNADESAMSTNERITMDQLVTKVIVVGKEDDEGRQKVEATVNGKTEYGVLQEVVQRDSDGTIAQAREEAQKILDERGTPKHIISVSAPDVPFVKKGDKVKINAGSLNGEFAVLGITHEETNRTMTMELEKFKIPTSTGGSSSGGEFNKGDSVILNGAVYRDSYGNGKGRTFTNYRGTITIKVDTSRAKPYHIDGKGWVDASNLTKA